MVRAGAREQFRKHDISLHTIGAYGIYSLLVTADIYHVQIGDIPTRACTLLCRCMHTSGDFFRQFQITSQKIRRHTSQFLFDQLYDHLQLLSLFEHQQATAYVPFAPLLARSVAG